MSLGNSALTRNKRASAIVIALIASLLVLNPAKLDSKADYIDSNAGPIVYNDRVCNLGNPNDHTTSDTAFEISTSEQLWEVTDCVSTSATIYFELGDDIDVSQATTAPTNSPIGYSTSTLEYSFRGVLNGKNRMISGISMSATAYGVGLFAYLYDATISNLAISGNFVTTHTGQNASGAAGGLAIWGDGSLHLSSISNQASVTGVNNVGGLLGYVQGDANISSSHNSGPVSGSHRVGGLVGYVKGDASLDSSYNLGTVSGSARTGGLLGIVQAVANITSSHNRGNVFGSDRVGGLVGNVQADANISSSFNAGTVTGSKNVGGLAGFVNLNANIVSSNNTRSVYGDDYVGGLVGSVFGNASIRSSHNLGFVSGPRLIGGLVGRANKGANVDSSYNAGLVSGSARAGGLVGWVNFDANISSSHNTGNVSGKNWVGGIVGRVGQDVTITSSYNTGMASGENYVGGLVGHVDDGHAKIDSSNNDGTVSATSDYVGGLLGYVSSSASITSSHNTGPVSGNEYVGGLLGYVWIGVNITSSYNAGLVSGSNYFGDLVGCVGSDADVSCIATTGVSNNPGLTPGQTPEQTPAQAPAPAYSGPVVDSVQTVRQGAEVTFTGNRLEIVTAAFIGSVQVSITSAASQSLVLEVGSSIDSGTHDLVLRSSMGTLTFQSGIRVLGNESDVTTEPALELETNGRLTVGSFRGFIALYTKGYEGQRLSAKVAGKWLVVESLDESFKGNDYSRTVRRTGSGYSIKVHLYIDREFVKTESLSTQ